MHDLTEQPTRAILAAVQLHGVDDATFASSIAELRRLATTLGLVVVDQVTQRRGRLASGVVLGAGKLKELAAWTGGTGEVPTYQKPGKRHGDDDAADDLDVADGGEPDDEPEPDDAGAAAAPTGPRCTVVLVDHDLTPTQQRNLERATDAEVMDRTSVILAIFHRHAKTREARLQVEIARLAYLAPRLRESGGGGDRVRGGVGGKGAGESSMELDRRRIRDRVAELRRELAAIEGGARTRRARRDDAQTVAVVGYTNAGKSSLMRALTGSEVYVADKLFATLDTTVRVLDARTKPPILLSDTVGFIKKLPHDLVASFRSTLDEASHADLLMHVVDASDAAFRDHMAVTRGVLGELGVDAPELVVLNKSDRLDDDQRAALAAAFPEAILMSAKSPDDVRALREHVVERFAGAAVEAELFVPWARHKLVHDIHARCRVVRELHEDDGTRLTVRAPGAIVEELAATLAAS
ncbi:MAG: GTPase HflX [Kofleriaceae bacterium]